MGSFTVTGAALAALDRVDELEKRLKEALDWARCPDCGCGDPLEAEAAECGCDGPACSIEVPNTLGTSYVAAVGKIRKLGAALSFMAKDAERLCERTRQVIPGLAMRQESRPLAEQIEARVETVERHVLDAERLLGEKA